MMIETLYRGKRTDNNEWVEGVYFPPAHTIITFVNSGTEENPNYEDYPVIPETVGRFTGLVIDNKKVFEGDIVRKYGGWRGPIIGEVVFKSNGARIKYADDYANKGYSYEDFAKNKFWQDGNASGEFHYTFSILGNKFDNPELLTK